MRFIDTACQLCDHPTELEALLSYESKDGRNIDTEWTGLCYCCYEKIDRGFYPHGIQVRPYNEKPQVRLI